MLPTQNEHSGKEESKTTLTDEIKEFIVRALARYDTPSQVAAAVQETFGIEISRQRVYRYDPGCSQPPAQRWADLHAATRAKFLAEIAEIGIAHRAVRLRKLDHYVHCADDMNQVSLVCKLLVQAAKECGGFYESRNNPLSRALPPPGGPSS